LKNESNKTYLEDFIRRIAPGPNPTNLDQGLLAATELLNSASGKKEIILFSDGSKAGSGTMYNNGSYEVLEKIVKDIKKKDIEINFIKIYSYDQNINPDYNKLAEAVGSRVIILNPDDRAIHSKEPSLFESCSMKNNETNIITVTTRDGTPISGAEISLDNFSIGETTKGELSYTTLRN
jgi:hypothetical protein